MQHSGHKGTMHSSSAGPEPISMAQPMSTHHQIGPPWCETYQTTSCALAVVCLLFLMLLFAGARIDIGSSLVLCGCKCFNDVNALHEWLAVIHVLGFLAQ
jgi:hypothetical protein